MITMKRKTLGYILLIIGILITIYGFYHGSDVWSSCPSRGCDSHIDATLKTAQDEVNNTRHTISGIGISISIMGIAILIRYRVST